MMAEAHGLDRLLRGEPELGAAMRGLDRLVRVDLDAWRNADERPLDAGRRGPLDLVGRVQDDVEHVRLGGGAQLLVALVVAVHDDLLAADPGPLRDLQLAQRGDVGAEAFLGEAGGERRCSGRPCCRRRGARSARLRGSCAPEP